MFHYQLSQHARLTIAARKIQLSWIERVLEEPSMTVRDSRDHELVHALGRISEHGDRVLRVIYKDSLKPWLIITAFFDRSMRDEL